MTDANKVIDQVIDAVVPDLPEGFRPLDTTVVQVRSVLNFMYALGYQLDVSGKTGRFVTEVKDFQGNRFLSFATAVKLHNTTEADWGLDEVSGLAFPDNDTVRLKVGFTALGIRLALASKLVKKVKLSVARSGQVICQDPMVKPLNMAVLQLVEPA